VKNMTVEEATAALTTAGFTVSPDIVSVIDSTVEPGKVLSTNPPFGQSAVQGTVIILTVAQAPDQPLVPNVTGQTAEAAKALLEAEPYALQVTIVQEPNADVAANTVLRTDPVENTPVDKGSKISVIVSAGPAKVRVPPVEGLTEAAARNQLTNRGLLPDVVYVIVAIGSPDDGHVISQSIPSTDSVLPGTTIRLRVGQAAVPPSTTTPPTTTTTPPTTTIPTPPSANLGITMTGNVSGSTVTYTIIARNDGPFDVTGARVTDNFPSGLTLVTWTCSDDAGANCPASGSNNIDVSVSMAVGTTVTFTVTATVTATGTLQNTATIAAPTGTDDPVPGNNTFTDTRNVPEYFGVRRVEAAGGSGGSGGLEEVAQQVVADEGQDAFGVELHAFDRERAVTNPHHDVARGRRHLEAVRHRLRVDHEAVVPRGGQR
jgi:uncharacterized repeat protein (TIGR01451 family)